jgi:hypothetical protein
MRSPGCSAAGSAINQYRFNSTVPVIFNAGEHLMKLKVILIIATVYMALIGIGHLVAPVALSAGVIPADASPGVVAFLRHYSALFIAIAVLNWMARNAEPSTARNAIVLANIVAFGLAAILDVVTVISGAGPAGLVPATLNLLIAAGFVWAGRTGTPAGTT